METRTDESKLILVLNSGSSSLKVAVYAIDESEQPILTGEAQGIGQASGSLSLIRADSKSLLDSQHVLETQGGAFQKLAEAILHACEDRIVAIGHRIVHGGPHLRKHQLITRDVLEELMACKHLAPIHIPKAIELYGEAVKAFPAVPHFACFDTVFHNSMPATQTQLPIPERFRQQGAIRYGFHGLSCESIMHRLGSEYPSRIILCHLGSGASVTAIKDGRSIANSMGMTPTGGAVMGTRSGDIDPGVLIFMLRQEHLSPNALEKILNAESGMFALSDGTSDMRALLEQRLTGNSPAEMAIEIFCQSIRDLIGAYTIRLGGLDLLLFTGGISEHSAYIRDRITDSLACIGLPDSQNLSKIRCMPADEELQITRICRQLLAQSR